MGYKAPTLNGLTTSVSILTKKYTNDNPTRRQLIHLLELIHSFIHDIQINNQDIPEKELHEICMGAWVFCQESIAANYHLLNPEYSPGYFVNTGSKLLKLINEQLRISKDNELDDKRKLIYLEKFYNFIIKNQPYHLGGDIKDVHKVLNDGNMHILTLRHELKHITKNVLHRVCSDVDKYIKAIPTEKAIDFHLSDMPTEYHTFTHKTRPPIWGTTKFENNTREFHVQLAQAVSALMGPKFAGKRTLAKDVLSREQRIEMGALLYIMQSIDNEYTFLSPTRSRLYNKCREILNIDNIADMDRNKMLDCITAFKNFMRDNDSLEALEKYGIEHFENENLLCPIDRKMDKIERDLNEMIKCVESDTLTCWSAARFLGTVGAMAAAPFGYGWGNMIGYFASETDYAVQPKLALGHGLNDLAVAYVARTAGYLGFLTADRTIQYTLERAFGKVLEQMFMLAGFAAVGFTGYLVFKVSVEGYKYVSGKLRDAVSKIDDPVLASEIDIDFINCLCNLPTEVFSEENKLRLENITNPQPHPALRINVPNEGPELAPLLVKEDDAPRFSHH